MSISTRRKFGILLIAIAAVAMIAFLVVGIIRGQWHYDGSSSWGIGQSVTISSELGISGYFLIPILLFGVAGAFCLAWPSRKPPKLHP